MSDGPHPSEMEIRARIAVLGYLVAQLFNMLYRAEGRTLEEVKEQHRKAKAQMSRQASQAPATAQSSQLAGEMEKALDNVLQMVEQLFER